MHAGTYKDEMTTTLQYWGRRLSHESDSMNLAVFMKFKFKGD